MVTAALLSVFAQETAAEIKSRWDELAAALAELFPKAAALMHEAKEDALAYSWGESCVYRHDPRTIGDRTKDLTENAPIHRGYQRRIFTSGATARPPTLATC